MEGKLSWSFFAVIFTVCIASSGVVWADDQDNECSDNLGWIRRVEVSEYEPRKPFVISVTADTSLELETHWYIRSFEREVPIINTDAGDDDGYGKISQQTSGSSTTARLEVESAPEKLEKLGMYRLMISLTGCQTYTIHVMVNAGKMVIMRDVPLGRATGSPETILLEDTVDGTVTLHRRLTFDVTEAAPQFSRSKASRGVLRATYDWYRFVANDGRTTDHYSPNSINNHGTYNKWIDDLTYEAKMVVKLNATDENTGEYCASAPYLDLGVDKVVEIHTSMCSFITKRSDFGKIRNVMVYTAPLYQNLWQDKTDALEKFGVVPISHKEKTIFTVFSLAYPSPYILMTSKNGQFVKPVSIIRAENYLISYFKVDGSQSAIFEDQWKLDVGYRHPIQTKAIKFVKFEPIRFISNNEMHKSVYNATSKKEVILNCDATGYPLPEVRFYKTQRMHDLSDFEKESTELTSTGNMRVVTSRQPVSVMARLVIRSPTAADLTGWDSQYTCHAKNKYMEAFRAMTLEN
ncbi:uncharacterized protein LOC141912813 [Tubulanus polymorphus]|uniref:uncharacterized protein LOC141912813 n=1 Tax=Tubulanus polymorphus TaxID=672921 RepID=UPI003DA66F8B